jgi:hypothetical protein
MLKLSFGEETMSRTQTSEWFLKFKNGITSAEDTEGLRHCFLTIMKLRIRSLFHRYNC